MAIKHQVYWPDINFLLTAEAQEGGDPGDIVWLTFSIYETGLEWPKGSGKPTGYRNARNRDVETFEEASPQFEGVIKWDGHCEITPVPTRVERRGEKPYDSPGRILLNSVGDANNFSLLLRRIYDLAKTMMPNHEIS